MRRAPACLTELLLKIDYHKIYHCLPWFLFWPYNSCDLSFFFFRGQCVFSQEVLLISSELFIDYYLSVCIEVEKCEYSFKLV